MKPVSGLLASESSEQRARIYVGHEASEMTEELFTSMQENFSEDDLQAYDTFKSLYNQRSASASPLFNAFADSMVAFNNEQQMRLEHELLSNTRKGDADFASRVVINYSAAYSYLKEQYNKQPPSYSLELILSLHRAVGKDMYATAGQLRTINVRAGHQVRQNMQ